ncbi:MAG: hypothetical protein QJR01_07895 [Kyrpidia sp.]|nr:hypothetical protein [Kyrpidia sp.]
MEASWTQAGYMAGLFILSGLAVLRFDVKPFAERRMIREAAWARGIGWFNIAAGAVLYAVRWAYHRWFWQ